MQIKAFCKAKKVLCILLAVLFVASLTVASASACGAEKHNGFCKTCDKEKDTCNTCGAEKENSVCKTCDKEKDTCNSYDSHAKKHEHKKCFESHEYSKCFKKDYGHFSC